MIGVSLVTDGSFSTTTRIGSVKFEGALAAFGRVVSLIPVMLSFSSTVVFAVVGAFGVADCSGEGFGTVAGALGFEGVVESGVVGGAIGTVFEGAIGALYGEAGVDSGAVGFDESGVVGVVESGLDGKTGDGVEAGLVGMALGVVNSVGTGFVVSVAEGIDVGVKESLGFAGTVGIEGV